MTYVSPRDLRQRVKQVRSKYLRKNPARLQLISILETVNGYLEQNSTSISEYLSEDVEKISLATWILGLESIGNKSWHRDPQYKKGYFWGWGSTLFSIFLEQLEINESKQISDKQKFVCLEKFFNFLVKQEDLPEFLQLLNQQNLTMQILKDQVKEVIQTLLLRISTEITGILHAIPTEEAIDKKMSELYEDYQAHKANAEWSIFNWSKAENKDRLILAQLAEVFAHILPTSPEEKATDENTMTRSQKIKMGLLLYILEIINNEYYLRSPKSNSVLFNLCCKVLNLEHLKYINNRTKLACISAFKNYFQDNKILEEIDRCGKEKFGKENLLNDIDILKVKIDLSLTDMTSKLLGVDDNAKPSWSATKTLGQIGALLMATPGYGIGFVLGYSASDTHTAVIPKLTLSNCLTYIGTTFLGFTRMGFGFLAADFIVQSTLTRAFAKVLEQMGMLVGYATGSAIGLTVDLSYQGLQHLCKAFLNLYEKIYDPVLMKNVDAEFVRSLMNLPPEIFSDDKRHKLEELTTENSINLQSVRQVASVVTT